MGNDFIPCLPFFNVREGAYQYLLEKYMEICPEFNSYLTDGEQIHFDALSIYLNKLAMEEPDILKYRSLCFCADKIVEDKVKKQCVSNVNNKTDENKNDQNSEIKTQSVSDLNIKNDEN